MSDLRKIKRVYKSRPTLEGAGVRLRRVFGNSEVPLFDPFLLLDDFRSDSPPDYLKGFPWHPHRGIETITSVTAGEVDHGDSLGNSGTISSGDVQWMTAGSGIIHQEMPRGESDGRMHGFQLWANLPAADKMMDPRYRGITAEQIPEVMQNSGTKIRVIAGKVEDVSGPVEDIVIEPEYLDISMPPGTTFTHPVNPGHTVFAYVTGGSAFFCSEKKPFSYEIIGENYFDYEQKPVVGNRSIVLYEDGSEISVTTGDEEVRFLLISGKPIGEPVAWYGPIVMNTREELQQAFDDYNSGNFIRKR